MTPLPASLWREASGPWERRAPLPGDQEHDVAVVGAGYTGLWTAYYLAEARPELEAQLKQSKATNRFGDIEDNLQNRLQDPGVTLAGLAKEFNLTTGEIPQFLEGTGGAPL